MSQIIFSFYGETKSAGLDPHLLTRSLLAQRILLSIREMGKSSSEIGAEMGVAEDFVTDELIRLSRNALVKKANGNRWISNVIILDEEEKRPQVDLAKQLADEVVLKIKDELPTLKAAFKKCSFKNQGFSWNHMDYIVLAALTADLGVNHSLHKKGLVPPPPERPDGGRWYFWGLQGGSGSRREFGVNSNSTTLGGTAHIWSRLVEKPTVSPFESEEIAIMLALVNQSLRISEIAEGANLSHEIVGQKMQKLSSLGYFMETKEKFKPNFPVFTEEDLEIMLTEIMRISDSIVDDVIKQRETGIRKLFEEMGLVKLNREYGAYLCMLYHMAMDNLLDKLVENNILPEMPQKASVNWGFWGWKGKMQLLEH